jgi:hypothetical protein
MPPFRTAFNGYAVKFSPFEEGRIAVATSQNFGIIGNGRQYVLQVKDPCLSPVLLLLPGAVTPLRCTGIGLPFERTERCWWYTFQGEIKLSL